MLPACLRPAAGPSTDRVMPIHYEIEGASGFIQTTCSGPVTLEEVMEHFRTLRADPRLPAHPDVLLDLRETTSVPDREQIRSAAEGAGQLADVVRWGACAIVASRDVMFGMSRMFEVFAEQHFEATQVFRELGDAVAWLGSRSAGARSLGRR
jgi:hypothetical protein